MIPEVPFWNLRDRYFTWRGIDLESAYEKFKDCVGFFWYGDNRNGSRACRGLRSIETQGSS